MLIERSLWRDQIVLGYALRNYHVAGAIKYLYPGPVSLIRRESDTEDHVVLLLDLPSEEAQGAAVASMLSEGNGYAVLHGRRDLEWVDEVLWEHRVDNYLMAHRWGASQDQRSSIADSYQQFLQLRRRGVRAHSWR